jgi:hypothetical protein
MVRELHRRPGNVEGIHRCRLLGKQHQVPDEKEKEGKSNVHFPVIKYGMSATVK